MWTTSAPIKNDYSRLSYLCQIYTRFDKLDKLCYNLLGPLGKGVRRGLSICIHIIVPIVRV